MEEGKLSCESKDIVAEKRQELLRLFPEALTEGAKIDFDQLKRALGESVDTGRERYGMNWPGKSDCFRLIQSPSTATLLPARSESVRFDETQNMIIEGDNLEVLKLLQKGYQNSVKMIYIDPPYNTGNDFIYPDDFTDNLKNYLQYTDQMDSSGKRYSHNLSSDGRFHSKWLNMMYPRLYLAKNLLREDGVVFISISEDELDNLKKVCDEVFGSPNFIGTACRIAKKSNNKGDHWAPNFDYIITYARDKACTLPFFGGVNVAAYDQVETDGPMKGERYQLIRLYMSNIHNRNPEQRFYIDCPDGSKIIPPGSTFPPERPENTDGIWRWSRKKFDAERDRIVIKAVRSSNLLDENRQPAKWNIYTKTFLKEVVENSSAKPNNLLEDYINQVGSEEIAALGIPFSYPKPSALIRHLIQISMCAPGDLILDFFAGSGSTAQASMEAELSVPGEVKFVLVQLPEPTRVENEDGSFDETAAWKEGYKTIADITKERVRRVIQRQEKELEGKLDLQVQGKPSRKAGFRVFKLAPSNFKVWDAHTDEGVQGIERQMELAVNHIMPDRSAEDLFYEILMKSEYSLTAKVELFDAAGLSAFSVEDDALIVCVERKVTAEAVAAIAKRSPSKVIFLDEAFSGNDQLKANAKMNFESAGVKRFETV